MRQLFCAEMKLLKHSSKMIIFSVCTYVLFLFSSIIFGFLSPQESRICIVFFWLFIYAFLWMLIYWPDEVVGKFGRIRMAETKFSHLICFSETKRMFFLTRVLFILFLIVVTVATGFLSQLPFVLQSFEAYLSESLIVIELQLVTLFSLGIVCLILFDWNGYGYVVLFGLSGGVIGGVSTYLKKDNVNGLKEMVIIQLILFIITVMVRYNSITKQERRK